MPNDMWTSSTANYVTIYSSNSNGSTLWGTGGGGGYDVVKHEPLTDQPLPDPKPEDDVAWLKRRVSEMLWQGDQAA